MPLRVDRASYSTAIMEKKIREEVAGSDKAHQVMKLQLKSFIVQAPCQQNNY